VTVALVAGSFAMAAMLMFLIYNDLDL